MTLSALGRGHLPAAQVAGIQPDGGAVVFELTLQVAHELVVLGGVGDENVKERHMSNIQ